MEPIISGPQTHSRFLRNYLEQITIDNFSMEFLPKFLGGCADSSCLLLNSPRRGIRTGCYTWFTRNGQKWGGITTHPNEYASVILSALPSDGTPVLTCALAAKDSSRSRGIDPSLFNMYKGFNVNAFLDKICTLPINTTEKTSLDLAGAMGMCGYEPDPLHVADNTFSSLFVGDGRYLLWPKRYYVEDAISLSTPHHQHQYLDWAAKGGWSKVEEQMQWVKDNTTGVIYE